MWAKVDDGYWKHRKVMALSMGARGLWVTALSYAGSEGGDHIPTSFVQMVCAGVAADAAALAGELVDAGLWDVDPDGDGWQVHDWSEFQAAATADTKATAGRLGGLKRALNAAEERAQAAEQALAAANGQAEPKQDPSTEQADGEAPTQAGTPGPEPEPENFTPTVAASGDDAPPDDRFETFWDAYPAGPAGKPGGDGPKKRAKQRWRRMTTDQRTAALEAVGNYAAHVHADGGPRACHASTWLNDERWDQWSTPARASPDGPAPPDPTKAAADRARNLAAQSWNVVADLLASAGHTTEQIAAARSAWADAQEYAA